ncbi:uncharacterized protein LOC110062330 isoform X2 [Orbicella faveolata]|uniref:uncharacterized protein LOC110062330 isoform X2 n=1 Tax=Orbicella faveolata TaxID=48498 RepID=UPI0009E2EC22|nr:uncharacterized protein LOC110062330 isoform X2 [Orbicella faveolata]
MLRMKLALLMAVVLLASVRNGEQAIMSCPKSDYALELTDFHIIDQKTDADLHKLKVYQENLLEITGSLTTNVPVSATSFTANVRLNLNGERYFLGMPFIVNQPVDCPDSLTASSSDPKQCVITALCDGLAAMLGAAETFSCEPISGVIYFRASELAVPPVKPGVIPSTVTNAWNPKVQIKIEIYTDGGTMISCISKELLLDVKP